MKWTPLIIGLTLAYFFVASISTFDLRLTQARRDGTLPPDEPTLPGRRFRLAYVGNLAGPSLP